jgi:hypothetical protein
MPEIAASNIAPKQRRSGKCLAWKSCTTHLTLWIHHTGPHEMIISDYLMAIIWCMVSKVW